MGASTKIEWCDRTWSPLRVRVKDNAEEIARSKGYASLVQIAAKMAGRIGPHCEHVSPGCGDSTGGGCYAEANNGRCLPANGTGLPYDRRSRDLVEPVIDRCISDPLRWRKRQLVFVENQSDIFGEWWPREMIDEVFAMALACVVLDMPRHVLQILTKRADRMHSYFTERTPAELIKAWARAGDGLIHVDNGNSFFSEIVMGHTCHDWDETGVNSSGSEYRPWGYLGKIWPLPNVWLGVSVEDQQRADDRIPHLLRTPAAVRWISAEPLLGPVELDRIPNPGDFAEGQDWLHSLKGYAWVTQGSDYYDICSIDGKVDWLVVGGESGPGARPMHPDWARSIRDQCIAAGVPFFFKQWGEWAPMSRKLDYYRDGRDVRDNHSYNRSLRRYAKEHGATELLSQGHLAEGIRTGCILYGEDAMGRVGKKAAGRKLDSQTWDQFPEVRA